MRFLFLISILLISTKIVFGQICNAPSASNRVICAGNTATLTASAEEDGELRWYDSENSSQVLATGTTFTTPSLSTTTTYYVQLVSGDCLSIRTPVTVTMQGGPIAGSVNLCPNTFATLTASGGTNFEWYDAEDGGNLLYIGAIFNTPILNSTTSYYVQSTVNGCVSPRTRVDVNILTIPPAPIVNDISVCSGSAPTLTASGSGVFQWFSQAVGGIPLITSPDFTTPALFTSTTYYVQAVSGSCIGARAPVNVTVNPIPALPLVSDVTICQGNAAILGATGAAETEFIWYSVPARGTPIARGSSFTTPELSRTTIYYVQASLNGCLSQRQPVTVNVNLTPDPPLAPGTRICSGSTARLTASESGGVYNWYDQVQGGSLLATGSIFDTPVLTDSRSFYVESVINSCVGPRTEVQVEVGTPPPPPNVSDVQVCSGQSVILGIEDTTGVFEWYDSAVGGNLLVSGLQYQTPVLTVDATYFVQAGTGTCVSERVAVRVSVNNLPAIPIVSDTLVCSGGEFELNATSTSGMIRWFDSNGSLLGTGGSYTSPPITSNTTFYVESLMGTCSSMRVPLHVQVFTEPSITFRYSSGTYCITAPDPRPQIFSNSGGAFTASPAGLVFLNSTTGEVDISASLPGSYTVTYTTNGACPTSYSRSLRITVNPDAIFNLEGPYCQGGSNPVATYPTGGSGGVFTARPAGLVFNAEGIDINASQPGTYIITNTIASNGSSCPAVSATDTVIILPAIVPNAGDDVIAGPGTVIFLSGSVPQNQVVRWSGGTGFFSNPDILNPSYTPGTNESTAVLTLRLAGNSPCPDTEDQLLLNFILDPPVSNGMEICSGNAAFLEVSGNGDTFNWYADQGRANLLFTGSIFQTPTLRQNTTYYVETAQGNYRSELTEVQVNVLPAVPAPIVNNIQICRGNTAQLNAGGNGTFEWFDDLDSATPVGAGPSFTSPVLLSTRIYYVWQIVGNCRSEKIPVRVEVNQFPRVSSRATETICNRSALSYQITSDISGTTFSWSRALVQGISNPAVNNQTTSLIDEVLISNAQTPVTVTYLITPSLNGCVGPSFNYVVTVDPSPTVISEASGSICNSSASNYQVRFDIPGSDFNWSRSAVAGISNPTINGQRSAIIREILTNTTNVPVDVTYTINHSFDACPGIPFNYVVRVNPTARITSPASTTICDGSVLNYQISSNVAGATFSWSRAAVNNISNPALTEQSSNAISETLENTGRSPVVVVYRIRATANGCAGPEFEYRVIVNPSPLQPIITSNNPVCVGSTIQIGTAQVLGASYLWTGPNGFTSTRRNLVIPNATQSNAGLYRLIETVNGCQSEAAELMVNVNEPPTAQAGPDQTICRNIGEIQLNGIIGGGTSTGIWISAGSGVFLPDNITLNARYVPSLADRNGTSLELRLNSTSADDCQPAQSIMNIIFENIPVVNAGPDQSVCSQNPLVSLSGAIEFAAGGIWSSSGTGTFAPSVTDLNAVYLPSSADILRGNVQLTLHATGTSTCLPIQDVLDVRIVPPPTVKLDPVLLLPLNRTVRLNPTVNYTDVEFLWSPASHLSDHTIQNPIATGVVDITYLLRVTDSRGCVTEQEIAVDVLQPIVINNTFSPNGDGVNDLWTLPELSTYPYNKVEVFNRYGDKVMSSNGYQQAWDGTNNGNPVPVGTYYYIINTGFPGMVYSGYVTVIR